MRIKVLKTYGMGIPQNHKALAIQNVDRQLAALKFDPNKSNLQELLNHVALKGKVNESYEHLVNFYHKESELRALRIDQDQRYNNAARKLFAIHNLGEIHHLWFLKGTCQNTPYYTKDGKQIQVTH